MCNSWFCTPELDALAVKVQDAFDDLQDKLIAASLDNLSSNR